jgi:signal transduction histidine kinase
MAFQRVFSLPAPVLVAAYLVGYVALDWLSYIQPFARFGITPWNPPTGLSFVLVLLFGQRFLPWLFVAPFLANVLVRHLPLSWPIELAGDAIIGGGYAAGLLVLLSPKARFNPALPSMRDVIMLLGVAALSSAVVATCFVLLLWGDGLIAPGAFVRAALRFWIGDIIGIAVVAPSILIFLTRGKQLTITSETLAQVAAILAALILVFLSAEQHRFELFYLLFLPVIWMAVRGGLELVTFGVLLTQIGLILCIQMLPKEGVDVTAFQALMLVLALSGLAAGAAITEHQRIESQLRRHQDSLAHVSRLGSMGELAAMVAHEINQPLMAAGTYVRLVADGLRSVEVPLPLVETTEKAVGQVQRAADVVRQLRALIRLDQSNRAPVSIDRIVRETIELSRPELGRSAIAIRLAIDPALPPVMVDLLQIEQAMLNLLKNAIEAIREIGDGSGTITITATQRPLNNVVVTVQDSGPGFTPAMLDSGSVFNASKKTEGLGIGLSLCRSIIESHGGDLQMSNTSAGACVTFTLPVAGRE